MPDRLAQPGVVVGVGMKMYLGYAESLRYLSALAARAERLSEVSLFVLPSFPVLAAAAERLAGTGIAFGAQDGHWQDRGPHTGSVSAAVLSELGCSLMEVGHAERRRDFGEDDRMVGRKAAAAARWGLVPVVCVGERLETEDAEWVVRRQLDAVLEQMADADAPLIVAYEPVWAIGGGRAASFEHVERVVGMLREATAARAGTTKLLYGGSVVPATVTPVIEAGADGIFASRSALTVEKLERVVAAAAAANAG